MFKWLKSIHKKYQENRHLDPVYSCDFYKTKGCSHVDGFLCDMKTCSILKDFKRDGENLNMNMRAAKNLLNEINAMILLSDKPLPGDYIALDWDGNKPSDFEAENQREINWYCSTVIEVDGDRYKVKYDDSWYTFKEFGTPKPSKKGDWSIYPALPLITEK